MCGSMHSVLVLVGLVLGRMYGSMTCCVVAWPMVHQRALPADMKAAGLYRSGFRNRRGGKVVPNLEKGFFVTVRASFTSENEKLKRKTRRTRDAK